MQARYHSTRLPGKMLLPLGDKPLIAWAWRAATLAFRAEHVVVSTTNAAANRPLIDWADSVGAQWHAYAGEEADVLGRFRTVAHLYRWHPDSIIVRVTPDDPFKDPGMMWRVATGERLPVEQGAEAFTLAMLDNPVNGTEREHLTRTLFRVPPPDPPPGLWTVDAPEDYEAARRKVGDA